MVSLLYQDLNGKWQPYQLSMWEFFTACYFTAAECVTVQRNSQCKPRIEERKKMRISSILIQLLHLHAEMSIYSSSKMFTFTRRHEYHSTMDFNYSFSIYTTSLILKNIKWVDKFDFFFDFIYKFALDSKSLQYLVSHVLVCFSWNTHYISYLCFFILVWCNILFLNASFLLAVIIIIINNTLK